MVRSAILQLTAAGLVALASPCIAIAQLDDPLHPWCGNDSTLWRLPRKPRVPDLSSAKAFTSVKAVMAQFDRGAFANSLPAPALITDRQFAVARFRPAHRNQSLITGRQFAAAHPQLAHPMQSLIAGPPCHGDDDSAHQKLLLELPHCP